MMTASTAALCCFSAAGVLKHGLRSTQTSRRCNLPQLLRRVVSALNRARLCCVAIDRHLHPSRE